MGISLERVTARRFVRGISRGRVVWLRLRSDAAAATWEREIDFLFVDADNSFEGAARDWADWSPHVRIGGVVVLQGARLADDNWVPPDHGPARLLREEIHHDRRWTEIEGVDAVVALRRVA